jgi:uncharacterized protein YggE
MRSKLFLLTPILVLALFLTACGPSAAPAAGESNTLSVSGNGIVYLTPDIATIYIGVHTEDRDISQALANNNSQAQAVVAALQNLGVALEDIQTTNFSVYNTEAYDEVGQKYTNYMVDNSVYITVRDLSKLGTLLSTVIGSGANNINSITFDVADKTAALVEARTLAIANANALAGELAQTAGVRLDGIKIISYSEFSPSPYYGMGGGGASAPNASVPIQAGQMQISVTVNVTYGIK